MISPRPATTDDLPALAVLFGSVEEAVLHRPSRVDAQMVEFWMQGVSLETDTWLVEEELILCAGAFARLRDRLGVFAGAVHPSAQGRGLGSRLVDLAESRLAGQGAERIQSWTVGGDEAADELFHGRGYREVRRFWEMAIELDEEPPTTTLAIGAFREEDARAFHGALEEAFADHWEHHAESFDEWWQRQQARSNYDPSLWFVIREGVEITAVARNEANAASGGRVGALGVRRPWRGRGYGRALLLQSFREFRRRGLTRATLGVDAANPTGAVRLYESVGMRPEQESVVWERLLR